MTGERLTESDIKLLDRIHRKIERAYPKPNFNGIYVTWHDMGKLPDEIDPFPYYFHGRMHEAGYFEANLVTWHELKTCGITIVGPEATLLPFEVDWNRLISNMHENLNTYWAGWITRARGFTLRSLGLYVSRDEIEWGVLGITRLFYTFREQRITTKVGAGEYALRVVPERWHPILRESINARRGIAGSPYRSVVRRKSDALAYMEYIRTECNKRFDAVHRHRSG